jgi:hypothetical protein
MGNLDAVIQGRVCVLPTIVVRLVAACVMERRQPIVVGIRAAQLLRPAPLVAGSVAGVVPWATTNRGKGQAMSLATKRWLRGLMRSWTAHAGTYIAVVGYLQTQDKLIDKYLGADATGILMMLFGLIVVALRARTTESLTAKGAK